MILAKNETAADYLGIHPNLDLALERITPEFFAALGDERVEILPEKVWCTRYTYDTIPEEGNFFEAHEKFLDIHVMLQGSEGVQIAPPAALTPAEGKPEKDFYAYHGQPWQTLVLSPGNFLVVWPNDAHKPGRCPNGGKEFRKAVLKLLVD